MEIMDRMRLGLSKPGNERILDVLQSARLLIKEFQAPSSERECSHNLTLRSEKVLQSIHLLEHDLQPNNTTEDIDKGIQLLRLTLQYCQALHEEENDLEGSHPQNWPSGRILKEIKSLCFGE